jgi:uncharacterized membrane protein
MAWLYILSVWLHILAATAWIGSMLFFAVVVVPAMRDPKIPSAPLFLLGLGKRYRAFGWGALGTLIVTGTTSLLARGIGWSQLASAEFWSFGFGQTLARKLGLVVAVVLATLAHDVWMGTAAAKKVMEDRTSAAAIAYRRRASLLGRATLLLSLAVLFFAVELVRGAP